MPEVYKFPRIVAKIQEIKKCIQIDEQLESQLKMKNAHIYQSLKKIKIEKKVFHILNTKITDTRSF